MMTFETLPYSTRCFLFDLSNFMSNLNFQGLQWTGFYIHINIRLQVRRYKEFAQVLFNNTTLNLSTFSGVRIVWTDLCSYISTIGPIVRNCLNVPKWYCDLRRHLISYYHQTCKIRLKSHYNSVTDSPLIT